MSTLAPWQVPAKFTGSVKLRTTQPVTKGVLWAEQASQCGAVQCGAGLAGPGDGPPVIGRGGGRAGEANGGAPPARRAGRARSSPLSSHWTGGRPLTLVTRPQAVILDTSYSGSSFFIQTGTINQGHIYHVYHM
jgi:hypothetical protein